MKSAKSTFSSVFLVFLFIPTSAAVAACQADGYEVVYINGVRTTNGDASTDLERFVSDYSSAPTALQGTDFTVGYNPTAWAGLADIGESIIQSSEPRVLEDTDLQTMLTELHTKIQHRRVLLVGHSQGTFYANAVHDFLIAHGMEAGAVAVYNIATPAYYVAGDGKYLTSSNDKVINFVRDMQAGKGLFVALPPNITLGIPQDEQSDPFGGHYFLQDYLTNADTRIFSDMNTELASLSTSLPDDPTGYCFDPPTLHVSTAIGNTILATAQTTTMVFVNEQLHPINSALANFELASFIASAVSSKIASLASAFYGSVISSHVATSAQGLAAGPSFVTTPIIMPTPTPVTPPQPSAPNVAVVQQPTPAPTPVPTQPQAIPQPSTPTPHAPASAPPPLVISPGFGGGGEPKHDPPPESPPPEALPPEAPHLLSMIFPKDNQLFSTSSVTASGTTTPTTTVTVIWGPTNSSDITVATTTSDEEGVWLIDLTLTEGEIALMAGAYDPTTDATSTDSRVITIDTTPPEAPVISSADCTNSDGLCLTASSTLDITWSDVPDALSYAIDQNGEESTTTTTSFTLTLPPDGATSTIAVAAIDQAGNVATSTALSAVYVASSTVALTSFPDLPFIPAGMVTGLTLDWSVYGVMPNSCTLAEIEPQDAQPWSVALEHAGAGSGSITAPDIAEPSSSELQATTTFMLSCTALDGTTVQVNKSILDMIMTMEI